MKKFMLWIGALAACASLTASCELLHPSTPSGEIPENAIFYTTVPGLQFFFVDAEGKDLVALEDRASWPIAAREEMSAEKRATAVEKCQTSARSDGRVYYIYNDNCNALSNDYETNRWGFTTYFWGKTRQPQYNTYLYRPDGGLDTLVVSYIYLSSDEGTLEDGVGWAVTIQSVKYNGIEIFDGNKNGKVYIQKPSQGDVVVKIGEL